MKIIDTNILLYVVNEAAPEHPAVRDWWNATVNSGQPLGFAWNAILGFLRISTNRRVFAAPLSNTHALEVAGKWLSLPAVRIVQETSDHWSTVRQLLETTGTAGNLTNDAHLAALAITHRATMVSCDADFLRFRELRWENPLANASNGR